MPSREENVRAFGPLDWEVGVEDQNLKADQFWGPLSAGQMGVPLLRMRSNICQVSFCNLNLDFSGGN